MNGIPSWLIIAAIIIIVVLLVGGSCNVGSLHFSGG
jgi:hypothetical protein